MADRDVFGRSLHRRRLLKSAAAAGLLTRFGMRTGLAQEADCPPPVRVTPEPGATPVPPTGKKVGVTVAYLSVPFYANFKTGLADGAAQFGLEYDLRDGQGDLAVEL